MKKTLLRSLFVFLGSVNVMALENTGMKSIQEGRAEYYCFLNKENPSEKGSFDQPVFAGGALIGSDSDSVIVSAEGKVFANKLDQMSFEELSQLNGAIMIFMVRTPATGVKRDLDQNLSLGIASFKKDPTKLKVGEELLENITLAGGYHKGTVFLQDYPRKLSLTCIHQSNLGKHSVN